MEDEKKGRLKNGSEIKLKNGGTVKIISLIGEGGQGEVYRVEKDKKEYALKYYTKKYIQSMKKPDKFYGNLDNNIRKGAPTDAFLWPIEVTEKNENGFGYIMEIRPKEYEELGAFFQGSVKKPQVHFSGFSAVITAGINIIEGFRALHRKGYSYQDLNDGNFFINPKTGDVLICDNDNVSPYGENFGILGKQRWMAPEIVTGKNDPDIDSDLFSLSVLLFRLLFINHPLEGGRRPTCLTAQSERKYYGEEPIFILDPTDKRNRPITGTEQNLKLFWPVYPPYLRDMFIRAFSQDVMQKRASRVQEIEWMDVFYRMRAELGTCPYCGGESFYMESGASVCPCCNRSIPAVPYSLKIGMFQLPLFSGMKLPSWIVDFRRNDLPETVGEVVVNPNNPNQYGIRNLTEEAWSAHSASSGTAYTIEPGRSIPLKEQTKIQLLGKTGTIIRN